MTRARLSSASDCTPPPFAICTQRACGTSWVWVRRSAACGSQQQVAENGCPLNKACPHMHCNGCYLVSKIHKDDGDEQAAELLSLQPQPKIRSSHACERPTLKRQMTAGVMH